MASKPTTESLLPFIEAWRVAGPWIDRIKFRALRRQTESQRIEARLSLYQLGGDLAHHRSHSGLVEQQAILRKLP
jgi:hypothetical protein